jgi:hypothetical protein
MAQMQFPVFVRTTDSGDIDRFDSFRTMQAYLEPIDVENGEYEAWDAVGMPLKLTVQKSSDWLQIILSEAAKPDQLARAISEYARRADLVIDASEVTRCGFASAFERIEATLAERRRSMPWWRRLLPRN